MFATAAAGLACAMLLLDAASGRNDLVTRRGAHLHTADGDRIGDCAVRKELRRTLTSPDHSCGSQRLLCNLCSCRYALQVVQANDLMLDPEGAREATLGNPTGQRHLSTLEPWLAAAGAVVAC